MDTTLRPVNGHRDIGAHIEARSVSSSARDGTRLLVDVDVDIRPGELVAIVGPSGAGKTSLLDVLAGVRDVTTGEVRCHRHGAPTSVGYVPQDDIVHLGLTVEATTRYAARLRLPAGTDGPDVELAVERALEAVGLTSLRHRVIGTLSGGQRKRASIATELVAQPAVCFLDEPTAGLDPGAGAALVASLRTLADAGTTVVMTTHVLDDLAGADRLMVVAHGRIAYDGPPDDAPAHFGVADVVGVLHALPAASPLPHAVDPDLPRTRPVASRRRARPRGGAQQWRVLTRRNAHLMVRSRMDLAIMAGSPVLVVAMFAVLFQPGSFDAAAEQPSGGVAVAYWLAFAGFFFGLTFGLLQVCTELAIVRRERVATIDVGPYLLAKATVLVPILAAVDVVMVATLRSLDRLPAQDGGALLRLSAVLLLDSLAGLALGIAASAAVTSAAQAALALPMLCFPAVLFSGAVVPIRSMAGAGRVAAALVSDRWAFEAVAGSLDFPEALAGSTAGRQVLAEHGRALDPSLLGHSGALIAFAVVFLLAAHLVLVARTGGAGRGLSSRSARRPPATQPR